MKAHHEPYFASTGEKLLSLRTAKGFTQQELANRCSVDRAKISMIENGSLDFRHSTLIEISIALGVDIKRLI